MNHDFLLVTCPQLIQAFESLHLYQKGYVDTLMDIWLESPPEINVNQKILVELKNYDPRKDTITRRYILPQPLAQWIHEVSASRGMPFTYQQSYNILRGVPDYGS